MQFLLHHNVITQAIAGNDHKTLKQCRDKNSAGWVLTNSLGVIHSELGQSMKIDAAHSALKKALQGIALASLTGPEILAMPPSSNMDYLDSLALQIVNTLLIQFLNKLGRQLTTLALQNMIVNVLQCVMNHITHPVLFIADGGETIQLIVLELAGTAFVRTNMRSKT